MEINDEIDKELLIITSEIALPTAISMSFEELEYEWAIPTVDDLLQCTDTELHNIATFITLYGVVLNDKKDLEVFSNRLLPERYKIIKQ